MCHFTTPAPSSSCHLPHLALWIQVLFSTAESISSHLSKARNAFKINLKLQHPAIHNISTLWSEQIQYLSFLSDCPELGHDKLCMATMGVC